MVLRDQTGLDSGPDDGDASLRRPALREPSDSALPGHCGVLGAHQENARLLHAHRIPLPRAGEPTNVLP